MSAASEISQQLHMFHNPFSGTTTQPKIPDGKVSQSLGFTTQYVGEVQNEDGGDTLEILLFPGMNTAVQINGSAQATLGRDYYLPGFVGSAGADWSNASPAGNTGFSVINREKYALWRLVSCGLQLKLLNSQEEDDGWWEAIRFHREINEKEWRLTTADNSSSNGISGTVAPRFDQIVDGGPSLVNEPSYSTGLLRDLHRVQFELHGTKDHHDVKNMYENIEIEGNERDGGFPPNNPEAEFLTGSRGGKQLIEQYLDWGYDMVYLRLHCRTRNDAGGLTGSRFHLNVVSNQECVYENAERESRFMTKAHNIGVGAASIHNSARRGNTNAASTII